MNQRFEPPRRQERQDNYAQITQITQINNEVRTGKPEITTSLFGSYRICEICVICGYKLAAGNSIKDMAQFKPQIQRFESLPSTNLEASRRAGEGAPEGLCIVASEQTAGRGRLERRWVSPKDAGLYFSIVLRPQFELGVWPLLTLLAAVAVQDALFESCTLKTDIKWPNDILVNNKKLCGILAETVETSLGRAVVVGIGINLSDNSFLPELRGVATSVEAATGTRPDGEVVLKALIHAMTLGYLKLQEPDGPAAIVREWCARSSYCEGKRIRVTAGHESLIGTTRGLESDGALRVETDDGDIRTVRAGDVTEVRLFDEEASL